MTMTQPMKMIFGCIASCILAFLFPIADAERTNPCSQNQYWVAYADGSTSCEDCPSCPAGQGLSEECGKLIKPSTYVICQECRQSISFSSKHDTSMCALCASCAHDQVVLRNCTPEGDIKCAKRCSSMDRYYNHAKGECLPCSKCCGDDHDLVEVECQEKVGPGSNMICSFDTSVNRCDVQSTNSRSLYKGKSEIAATPDNYTSPSQGFKSEQPEPPTESNKVSQRKDQDFWTAAIIISVVILALIAICCCCYIYKTGHANGCFWCHRDAERGSCHLHAYVPALDTDGVKETLSKIDKCRRLESISPPSLELLLKEGDPEILTCSCEVDSTYKKDVAKETLSKIDKCRRLKSISPSLEPLLKEGAPENLSCSCEMDATFKKAGAQENLANLDVCTPTCSMLEGMSGELREPLPKEGDSGILPRSSEMATKKDSKPLSSLLERESDLQNICECLDARMPGVGHYRAVALYYGSNHCQIVSVFEKHCGGPSRALMEFLKANKPEVTVAQFASVVRKEAKRNDVVKLLEEYDLK